METAIKNIVVPVDFSDASERAASYAAALARRLDASIHLIHVLEPSEMVTGPFEFHEVPTPAQLDRVYWGARKRLIRLGEKVAAGQPVSTEVRYGVPFRIIAAAVIDYGADLVVMATHGRSGLSHLVMGSVAEQVIQSAACPVLVIRDCGQVHVRRTGSVPDWAETESACVS